MSPRKDPEGRRRALAAAVVEVVAEVGVGRTTHRMVAARAGVPLGATTYYFPTLNDLIAAGLAVVSESIAADLDAWRTALRVDCANQDAPEAIGPSGTVGRAARAENRATENDEAAAAQQERAGSAHPPDVLTGNDHDAVRRRLPERLARLVGEYVADQPKALLEYELYLAAARAPALRPLARAWLDGLHEVLAPMTGDAPARSISALIDGAMLQSVVTGDPVDEAALTDAIRILMSTFRNAMPSPG